MKFTLPKFPKNLTAATADKHLLYMYSVQTPQEEIALLERMWKEYECTGSPRVLHEDFCGTAYLSYSWAASRKNRQAVGFDIDPDVQRWFSRETNLINSDLKSRVSFAQDDLLKARASHPSSADIVHAGNYSWWYARTKEQLLTYLRNAYNRLDDAGLLIMDSMSVANMQDAFTTNDGYILRHRVSDNPKHSDWGRVSYGWEHERYNMLTAELRATIGFGLPDGESMHRAFVYDWRVWFPHEVIPLMESVGFQNVRLYNDSAEGPDGEENWYIHEDPLPPRDSDAWIYVGQR